MKQFPKLKLSVDQTLNVRWIRHVNSKFVKIHVSFAIRAAKTLFAGRNNTDPSAFARMDGVVIHNSNASDVIIRYFSSHDNLE